MWTRYEVIQFGCLAVVAFTGLLMLSTLFSTSNSELHDPLHCGMLAVLHLVWGFPCQG
jgi:hypothetical protein